MYLTLICFISIRLFCPFVVFVRVPQCHAYTAFKAKCRPIVMKCRSIFSQETFLTADMFS